MKVFVFLLCLTTGVSFCWGAPSGVRLPNIVLVVADDLGYGDLAVYGSQGLRTRNLDRLAWRGRILTSFYTPITDSAASRAALLTGCYPRGTSVSPGLSQADDLTLAEIAQSKGYATGAIGTWHQTSRLEWLPTRRGFESFFGLVYPPQKEDPAVKSEPALWQDEALVSAQPDERRLTAMFTARAVGFIRQYRSRPFLLYVSHHLPRAPIVVSEKFQGENRRGPYADALEELDWSVGEIISALKDNDILDETLIVFTSDSGPWLAYGNHAGSAGRFREGKGTVWEGGVRVPCIVSWPRKVPQNTAADGPAMTIDLLPTIARLIGVTLPPRKADGRNIWPLVTEVIDANSALRGYFFFDANKELIAVRSNKWKLVLPHEFPTLAGRKGGANGIPAVYQPMKTDLALYNLASDQGETRNIAARHPEVVASMQKLIGRMRETLEKGSGKPDRPVEPQYVITSEPQRPYVSPELQPALVVTHAEAQPPPPAPPQPAPAPTPTRSFADYSAELAALRQEVEVTSFVPEERFFFFGMGPRSKYVYRAGEIRTVPDGDLIHQWKIKRDEIIPAEYLVTLTTESGEKVHIQEDTSGVWITTIENHVRLHGTDLKLHLPEFASHRFSRVLRVLHHELLMNMTKNGPVLSVLNPAALPENDVALVADALRLTGNAFVLQSAAINGRGSPAHFVIGKADESTRSRNSPPKKPAVSNADYPLTCGIDTKGEQHVTAPHSRAAAELLIYLLNGH